MLDLRWWVVGAIETLWDCLGKQKVDVEEEEEERKLEEYIDLCWEQDGPTRLDSRLLDPRPVMLFMYIDFPLFDITELNNCFHRKFTDVWLIINMFKD